MVIAEELKQERACLSLGSSVFVFIEDMVGHRRTHRITDWQCCHQGHTRTAPLVMPHVA
jgi:hypothetical protein